MKDTRYSHTANNMAEQVPFLAYALIWLIAYTVALVVGWPCQWLRNKFIRARYHLIYEYAPSKRVQLLRKLLSLPKRKPNSEI
jgi:hypothetical protein